MARHRSFGYNTTYDPYDKNANYTAYEAYRNSKQNSSYHVLNHPGGPGAGGRVRIELNAST